jgi:anti-sigma factor RsiW
MKVTRDVVTDLWPIYESGEASVDTKAMVDEFLASDSEFARRLRENQRLNGTVTVPPDAEAVALRRTRDLVRGNAWLRGLRTLAVVLTGLSFGRIISDTSWDVSPRPFIVTVIVAAICWVSYGVLLHRYRQRSLQ